MNSMTNVVSFAGATGKSLVLSDVLSRQEFKTSTLQSSTEINLQAYFAQVRERYESGEKFPYDVEELVGVAYANKSDAVKAVLNECLQDFTVKLFTKDDDTAFGGKRSIKKYFLSPSAFEFLVARRCRPLFEVYHRVFHAALSKNYGALEKFGSQLAKAKSNDPFAFVREYRREEESRMQLYAVLFTNGVVKVGKSVDARRRIQQHREHANRMREGVAGWIVDKEPKVFEKDLIAFCARDGLVISGAEYFINVTLSDILCFLKQTKSKSVNTSLLT